MAIIHHKHDITSKTTYTNRSYPTNGRNLNKTITKGINLGFNGSITNPYYGWSGNYTGGFYKWIADSTIKAGYMYPSYPKSSGSYLTGSKLLAILDVFTLQRYPFLSTGLNYQLNQYNPGGLYSVPNVSTTDNWVAWSIYDPNGSKFTGNYCTGTASSRMSFNLTPLDSFLDVVSHYDLETSYTWASKTGGASAPSSNFSTSFNSLKTGNTLSSSGSSIRITNGHPTNQYLIQGKSLRFHGFLSYSGPFTSTTYAFVTVADSDVVAHTARNSKWGGSQYPTRDSLQVTHTVLPMCRLVNNSVGVSTYTPVVNSALYSATPEGFTGGGVAAPVSSLASLVANPLETTVVTDVNGNPLSVPNWMTGDLFTTESAIYLESDGGNVDFLESGYYGTDTVYALWDLDNQTWTGYTGYSGGGGGPTYYTFILSDFLGEDNMDPMTFCGIPGLKFTNTVYTSTNSISQGTVLYTDTALTTPYTWPQRGWYRIADSTGTELTPTTMYLIDDVHGQVLISQKCR